MTNGERIVPGFSIDGNNGAWREQLTEEQRERPTLAATQKAVDEIDELYREQFNPNALYPANVSNEHIKQAAVENPAIFSPYTIVKNENGKLIALPYYVVFGDKLEEVAKWIDAARISTQNSEFRDYLGNVMNELMYGEEYREKTLESWLSMREEPPVDFLGVFSDRYDDKRFGKKFAPQAWTGTIDRQTTNDLQDFTNKQLVIWKDEFAPEGLFVNTNMRLRAQRLSWFGGLARAISGFNSPRRGWSANNQPSEIALRSKYGSKITLFLDSLEDYARFNKIPVLRKIIPTGTRRGWSEEDLVMAGNLLLASHEPSHSLIRRPGDEERLGNTYSTMNEMYSTSLGLAILGRRDDIPEETKNAILAMHFATTVTDLIEFDKNKKRIDYLRGGVIIFNTLIERKAIAIDTSGQIRWDDSRKIFEVLREQAVALEQLIARGDKGMARRWQQADGKLDNVRSLAPIRAA
ncbi:MAG: hypothetical protein NUV69_03975 [Candidatus Curtissbacteria bacterium]|nr:hypothetical protein [Candidatus Curtissbacteria bacterium]